MHGPPRLLRQRGAVPGQQVALEVTLPVEGVGAQGTLEGPQPCVDAEVLLKVEGAL